MLVGIAIEHYKTSRSKKVFLIDQKRSEILKINTAIVSFSFNMESVHTLVKQYVMPAYEQCNSFRKRMREAMQQQGKPQQSAQMPFSDTYPAVATTYPEMFLIEFDFLKETPFIIENDASLVKNFSWIIEQQRELQAAVKNYNEIIILGWNLTTQMNGLPSWQLDSILHRQIGIINTQCLLSYQILDLTQKTIKELETINRKYEPVAKKFRADISDELQRTLETLRQITSQPLPNPPA